MSLIKVKSTEAKTCFGKYFKAAQNGTIVIIQRQNDNKEVAMIKRKDLEEILEIYKENSDTKLMNQLQNSYKEYKENKCQQGIEVLIDIMNETKKKELLS